MSNLKGLVKVDKPADWTSFDVVNKIRSVLRNSLREQTGESLKLKVGHSGTLDPFATGLLLIAYGSCTKQLQHLLKQDKTYSAVLRLGARSDTGDTEGKITELELPNITEEEVQIVFKKFTGTISQTPPAYSAIKIDGEAAYKKARRGENVQIEPRKVTVHNLTLIEFNGSELSFVASVSSGTYIRTLGEDIAKALGTEGYLTELRRTQIGDYNLNEAINLDDINYDKIIAASFEC